MNPNSSARFFEMRHEVRPRPKRVLWNRLCLGKQCRYYYEYCVPNNEPHKRCPKMNTLSYRLETMMRYLDVLAERLQLKT